MLGSRDSSKNASRESSAHGGNIFPTNQSSPENSTHGGPPEEMLTRHMDKVEHNISAKIASMELQIAALHTALAHAKIPSDPSGHTTPPYPETEATIAPKSPQIKGLGLSMMRRASASFTQPFQSVDKADVRGKYPAFAAKLGELYPGALPHSEAAVAIAHVLRAHGFEEGKSLAMVSQCRDELTKPFTAAIDALWGGSFNISSLGGMVFCGKTGFKAAMAHAPIDLAGKESYVVFSGPHIGIAADGEVGATARKGRPGVSHACGALIAFGGQLGKGELNVDLDPHDIEMSHLKQHVIKGLGFGGGAPSIAKITHVAYESTVKTVAETLDACVDRNKSSHAIVSGILVHGPDHSHYFWPGVIEVVTLAGRKDVTHELRAATRDQYIADMIRYKYAKAKEGGLICEACNTDVAAELIS